MKVENAIESYCLQDCPKKLENSTVYYQATVAVLVFTYKIN